MNHIIQLLRRTLPLLILPGWLCAQDFPDIRIDTTARKLDYFEGTYDLSFGQGGEFWDLEANSILKYAQYSDHNPNPPGVEVGRWSLKGDSLILRIEKKIFRLQKKKPPFTIEYKMMHLEWNFLAYVTDAKQAVPCSVYFTILIDNKEIKIENLMADFIGFVRSETGITSNYSRELSVMLRMVDFESIDFFRRRGLFYSYKAYQNGERVK